MAFTEQEGYRIRLEWGEHGVTVLSARCTAVILVDVLSFTTCVDIALANGAVIYPCRWKDGREQEFAASRGALLAGRRGADGARFSLSPSSLRGLRRGEGLVLPSPNGSALTLLAAGSRPVYAACLRNARAVAEHVQRRYDSIAVVPCGERWEDGSLRPALEDLIGAGAVVSCLAGAKSPEALAAQRIFDMYLEDRRILEHAASGVELGGIGYGADLVLAGEVDVSRVVPHFDGDRYYDAGGAPS